MIKQLLFLCLFSLTLNPGWAGTTAISKDTTSNNIVNGNFNVPSGVTETIASGGTLTLAAGSTFTLGSPLSVANGGTASSTARGAGATIGVYQMSPAAGNAAEGDMQVATPAFAGQLGNSYYANKIMNLWVSGSTTTGDWTHAVQFQAGIPAIGNSPSAATMDNTVTGSSIWNLNGGTAGVTAAGDSGLLIRNWSHSTTNSGSSVGPVCMSVDGGGNAIVAPNNNGLVASTFADVPKNRVAGLIPGTAMLVFNEDDNDLKQLSVCSPNASGFDAGNYSYQVWDLKNKLVRVPFWVASAYQPSDAGWLDSFTISPATGATAINGALTVSPFSIATSPGRAHSITGGATSLASGSTVGGAITITGGASTGASTTGTGGAVTIAGGAATSATTKNGGSVTINAGSGATANGNVNIGSSNTATVAIGTSTTIATTATGLAITGSGNQDATNIVTLKNTNGTGASVISIQNTVGTELLHFGLFNASYPYAPGTNIGEIGYYGSTIPFNIRDIINGKVAASFGASGTVSFPSNNTVTTAGIFYGTGATPAHADGTNATATVAGTNLDGTLQVVIAGGASTGVITTLTLGNSLAFPTKATMTLTPANAATANLLIADDPFVTGTTTTVVLNTGGTGMPVGTYLWNYHIGGY